MAKSSFITIGKCKIPPSVTIMDNSIVGKKFRKLLNGKFDKKNYPTTIGQNVYIGYSCLIGNGTVIRKNSIIDDKSIIESFVEIGERTLLIYQAQVCNEVIIGNNCVIAGLIGERTKVGNHCRIFGKIVHSQHHPLNPWDDDSSEEEAVTIHNNVFIGFKAIIAGNISIGPKSYVLSGSLISKNVPPMHIAYGVNKIMHHSKWKGNLKNSNLFK